jgi:hypothetical protein
MRLPVSVARGLVLFSWDVLAVGMDALTCWVVGCDWTWQYTTNGPEVRCARSGCTYKEGPDA